VSSSDLVEEIMTPEEAIKRGQLMVRWGESALRGDPIRLRFRNPHYKEEGWGIVDGYPSFSADLEYEEAPKLVEGWTAPSHCYSSYTDARRAIGKGHRLIRVREVEE
jgi:hypothetical protein